MLKESLNIGKMTVNNRLVMPPMATAKSTPDGVVTEELCEYYRERAEGGKIGLIITEHSYISKDGKASNGQLSIAEDTDVEGLKKLTETIHSCGSKVIAQINHAGSAALPEVTGCDPVGPSALMHPRKAGAVLPKELSKEDICRIEDAFAAAALRAKEAGFDGVEIHSAHAYLLNQFYSPLTNHRSDEYGVDTMENRIRIHLETVQKVRKAVGEDYPIALRLGGCDYTEGGSTLMDAVAACVLLEQAGVDLLDISGGMRGYIRPDYTEPGYFSDMTAAIKAKVQVPVLLTGGVTKGEEAENLLAAGAADLIGVGRAIFKDADWARNEVK
ncbi:MAG: NADH:flavin oxidoreductase [Clostridiales bacterium]|nr:NADH:flavin oxidoreductase [Clostridiales bacterium]